MNIVKHFKNELDKNNWNLDHLFKFVKIIIYKAVKL